MKLIRRMQIASPAPKTWKAFLGSTINTMYWDTDLKKSKNIS